MNEKQNLENNRDLQIKDSDIATVEAMHDLLLEKGYLTNFITLQRSRVLTAKMHAIIDLQKQNPQDFSENILCNLNELAKHLKLSNLTKNNERELNLIKEIYLDFIAFIKEPVKSKITKPTSLNILEEANDIIFNRAEEKQREYGPIDESLEDTAIVASIISNESINIEIVYAVLMGLKISRMRWNKKHDTFLDSIGYTAAFETYLRKTEKQNEKK